ncbi:MAG: hypothetical protein L3J59_03980 [Methylococcaceae bacterium]|nr:hypothetical protein [Methylococcaceae bacterium]
MIYETLFKNILFPTIEKIKGRKTFRYLEEYSTNELKSSEELQAVQFQKLKKLLQHSQENVSYYKKQWKSIGFDWREVRSLADYSQLPVLTKTDIRDNYNELIAENFKGKSFSKATGGSTGQPLKFEFSTESNERRIAVMMRGYGWAGLTPSRKSLHLWGGEIGKVSKKRQFKMDLYHAFYGRKMLNSFNMTINNMVEYVDNINKYRPKIIVAYVAPLVMLAEYIQTNSLSIWTPESIITGAEGLLEFQRKKIEAAFGCKVFNTYGSREFMLIASECEQHDGLHINIDHLVVEICEKGVPCDTGDVGDIVISDLHNYAMPFIRYEIGDIASMSPNKVCQCGKHFPLLKNIEGRKLDVIRTPDGRTVPGEFFPHLMKDIPNIVRFQVIQEEIGKLIINYIVDNPINEEELIQIKGLVEEKMGKDLDVEFRKVDDIPLTQTGKHRVTISRLSNQ